MALIASIQTNSVHRQSRDTLSWGEVKGMAPIRSKKATYIQAQERQLMICGPGNLYGELRRLESHISAGSVLIVLA